VFHYTVMFAVNTWITQNVLLTLLLTLTITTGLAELSRRFVEAPAARLRNRVLARSGRAANVQTVTSAQ
jgi:peptidoglycan/LPS O-acetylase OafA/YrhL